MRAEARALRIVSKRKLENCHSGKAETLANRLHFGCNYAQVFGQNRQLSKFRFKHGEQFGAWSFHPFPILGCPFAGRNFPISLKSAEVIYAHHIEHSEESAETLDPPGISIACHAIPVVDRIAP